MTTKKQKLSDFRLQQRNGNKHSPRGMGMLDNTIATEGWISAITVCNDGEAIDGSARLETAYSRFGEEIEPIVIRSNGDRPIIHIREDTPTADDPKAKVLSIAANRISELNYVPDLEILAEFSEEVDLSGLYFEDELEKLLNGIGDAVPSELKKQRWSETKSGGNHHERFSLHRLHWQKIAPTIQKTATGSSGMMHPDKPRELYTAELKRIGSFPDSFKFLSWESSLNRIGNSVPPNLMKAIALHIKQEILAKVPE